MWGLPDAHKNSYRKALAFAFTLSSTLVATSFASTVTEKRNQISSEKESTQLNSRLRLSDSSTEQSDKEWIVVFNEQPSILTNQYKQLRSERVPLSSIVSTPPSTFAKDVASYERLITEKQSKVLQTVFSDNSESKIKRRFTRTINAAVVLADTKQVESLRKNASVKGVFENKLFQKSLSESVEMIGASTVWELQDSQLRNVTGEGVTVAIVDSGVDYTHSALGGCIGAQCKVIGGYDFVDDDDDPMDFDGHGTHVAGIVAANSSDIQGVAPGAHIMAVRVLDDDGYGWSTDIIAGIEYAVDPDGDPSTDDGADVINLSLGGDGGPDSPGSLAADAAAEAGVVVVAAAGNDGSYRDIANHSPASSRLTITVGSVDKNGSLSSFSSKGPMIDESFIKPEIVAPGGDIYSLAPNENFESMSGTSMASPHVAGAAALLLQANPSLSQAQVKATLLSSAKAMQENPYAVGYGLLQIDSAISKSIVSLSSPLDFGEAPDNDAKETKKVSFILSNLSQQAQTISLDTTESFPAQVSVSLSSTEFSLGAGQSKTIEAAVTFIDAGDLPFPDDSPGAYFASVQVSSNEGKEFDIPFAFTKSRVFTLKHDSPSYIDVSIDTDTGDELYWGSVNANEDLTVYVQPGQLFITVDYLELKASDVPNIEGIPEGASVSGLETYVVEITESTELLSSIKNLSSATGVSQALNSDNQIENLHTANTKLNIEFEPQSGTSISYSSVSSSNTQIQEGQRNKHFVIGNLSDQFKVSYEILERLENNTGQDALYHYWTNIDDTFEGNLYALQDSYSLDVSVNDDLYTSDVDFTATAIDTPSDSMGDISGITGGKFTYHVNKLSNIDQSVYISLIDYTSGELSGDMFLTSPAIKFGDKESFYFNSVENSTYHFDTNSYVFSETLEFSEGSVYGWGNLPLSTLVGGIGNPVYQRYAYYCDGVLLNSGSMRGEYVSDILSGCYGEGSIQLVVSETESEVGKRSEISHQFQTGFSAELVGLKTLVTNSGGEIITTPDIGIEATKIYFKTSENEALVSGVFWRYNGEETWNSVNLDVVQNDDYTQSAQLPAFYTDKKSIDIKIEHSSITVSSEHKLFRAFTVGADLDSVNDDVDGDGIVNALDNDNDNDGMPDTWEEAYGLNPVDAGDANTDFDNDGLSNTEEFKKGSLPNTFDSDGDGIRDGLDAFPIGNQDVLAGTVYLVGDTNHDGNSELAVVAYQDNGVVTQILDGSTLVKVATYTTSFEVELDSFAVQPLEKDGDIVTTLAAFGVRSDDIGSGKPRVITLQPLNGKQLKVYNWPDTFVNPSPLILDDINDDGALEIGVFGINKDNERPQFIIRDGETAGGFSKLSFPSTFVDTSYMQYSDSNNDGVNDIALVGKLARNDKIQVKITDPTNDNVILAYTFPSKWENTSWQKLSDIDYDGINDWGLFGKSNEDGKWMLMQKSATSAQGMLQIHAWPSDLVDVKFIKVPDLNGDGVDEVAVSGFRESANRHQLILKDGADRNVVLGSYGWPNDFSEVSYKIVGDLTGDGLPELVFSGRLDTGAWQLFITDMSSNTRIERLVLDSAFSSDIKVMTNLDINFDSKKDLTIIGKGDDGLTQTVSYIIQ